MSDHELDGGITPRIELTRFSNPIRDAIFEATFGNMDTALAIARGEIPGRPNLPPEGPLPYGDTDPTTEGGI